MNRLGLLAGGILASAAVAVAAQTTDEAEAPTSRDDPNRVVCVNITEIGSRLNRRRVCRTKAEWDDLAAQTRNTIDRVQQVKTTGGD